MKPRLMLAILALTLALPLGACGKKADNLPPEDQDVTYPRSYPQR